MTIESVLLLVKLISCGVIFIFGCLFVIYVIGGLSSLEKKINLNVGELDYIRKDIKNIKHKMYQPKMIGECYLTYVDHDIPITGFVKIAESDILDEVEDNIKILVEGGQYWINKASMFRYDDIYKDYRERVERFNKTKKEK